MRQEHPSVDDVARPDNHRITDIEVAVINKRQY